MNNYKAKIDLQMKPIKKILTNLSKLKQQMMDDVDDKNSKREILLQNAETKKKESGEIMDQLVGLDSQIDSIKSTFKIVE